MIDAHDCIELPLGVELRGDEIVDSVRGATLRLNPTAARLVTGMQTGPIAEVAAVVAQDHDVPAEVVEADATRLCAELNARLLVNVRRAKGSRSVAVRWMRLALVLLPLSSLPVPPYWRYPALRGSAVSRGLVLLRLLALRSLAFGLLVGGAIGLLLATMNVGLASLSLALLTAAAFAIAAPFHELGHVLALRRAPCFVVARGARMAVVHNSGRNAFVAAAGPLSGLVLAIPALGLTPFFPQAAFLSVLLAGQLIGLTVLGKDGRNACGLA